MPMGLPCGDGGSVAVVGRESPEGRLERREGVSAGVGEVRWVLGLDAFKGELRWAELRFAEAVLGWAGLREGWTRQRLG